MLSRFFIIQITLAIILSIPLRGVIAESLSGQIVNANGIPIPGMEVILYNPRVGPSPSQFTDTRGKFFFNYVPFPANYDLELYWRRELVFRRLIYIRGYTRLAPITLY